MKNTPAPPPATPMFCARVRAEQPDLRDIEIANLRALVTRLTNVAADLAAVTADPGTEALAAIYCGRRFIYG